MPTRVGVSRGSRSGGRSGYGCSRQEGPIHRGKLRPLRISQPRVLNVFLVERRDVMLSEARDRHVEDVLREDPERIRRGNGGRNDGPWPSPWESHLSAPSAAEEEHREYVTFFDRLSRDGLRRRTKPSRRANKAQVSVERCPGGALSRGRAPRIGWYFDGCCAGTQ